MGTRIFITILLLTSLNRLYGQVNLNELILNFQADCSESIAPEDSVPEFTLLNLSTTEQSTNLNFTIIANCAQQKMGRLLISGDTLVIRETDVSKVTSETNYETDSLGNQLEVTTETYVTDYAFCDCLVNFNYQFLTPLDDINYLTFHERTFMLDRTEKNAR